MAAAPAHATGTTVPASSPQVSAKQALLPKAEVAKICQWVGSVNTLNKPTVKKSYATAMYAGEDSADGTTACSVWIMKFGGGKKGFDKDVKSFIAERGYVTTGENPGYWWSGKAAQGEGVTSYVTMMNAGKGLLTVGMYATTAPDPVEEGVASMSYGLAMAQSLRLAQLGYGTLGR